jgi:hypothetical protein
LAQRPGFAPTRNNYTPAPPGRHFDPRYLITVADAPVPSGKSGQPQYRQAPSAPGLHLSFGLCEAMALTLAAPYTTGCAVNGVLCGSALLGNPGGLAGCVAALGPCSIVGGLTALCYAQGRGLSLPQAPHAP